MDHTQSIAHQEQQEENTFMSQEQFHDIGTSSSLSSSISSDSPALLEPKVRAALALQRETR